MLRLGSYMIACVLAVATYAQVPSGVDPEVRALEERHADELKAVAADIREQRFPYHFYLTRRLDVSERQARHAHDNSVHFGKFRGRVVLVITGNYYAAYSSKLVKKEQRAERTFRDVMFPILAAAVEHFQRKADFDGYALEVSHHIIGDVLGVTMENAENVVVVLPRRAAERLVATSDVSEQQAAISDGLVFVNAEPVTFQLRAASAQ